MTIADVIIVPELPAHDSQIEDINAEAFGPGRYTRAAYRIREGGPHDRTLSFVALNGKEVIASVRLTPVMAGAGEALLLGPLAVRPRFKNRGIGRKLVAVALEAARRAGAGVVLLVGDAPYYGALGFSPVPPGQIAMPGPVDPARMLAAELKSGALGELRGLLRHAVQNADG